jgi:hypothetical protein
MTHSSHVLDSPFYSMPYDLQKLVRDLTETSFAVESVSILRFRFPEGGWMKVPYLIRYEFKLLPRNLRDSPEFEVRVSRALDPGFKQSNMFRYSDSSMQEMLVNNFKEVRFSAISGVQLSMRVGPRAPLTFLKFVPKNKSYLITPWWSFIEDKTIEEVREKLKSMFHMEFEPPWSCLASKPATVSRGAGSPRSCA